MQIVDARTFQGITGLNPPPTPITAETYAKYGYPFFQFADAGQNPEAAAGQWGAIKGVAETAEQQLQQKKHAKGETEVSKSPTGRWGLLRSGAWGQLDKQGPKANVDDDGDDGAGPAVRGEQSFDFPVVMLDIDDSLPKFKSVAEAEDDDWSEY